MSSPRGAHVYIALTCGAALLLLCVAWSAGGWPQPTSWFVALVALGTLTGIDPPKNVGRTRWNISSVATLAAMPLVGPFGAAIVALAPMVLSRSEAQKWIFNAAMRTVWAVSGGFVYGAVAHTVGLSALDRTDPEPIRLAVAMASSGVTMALLNTVLLSGVIRLTSGVPVLSTVRGLRNQMAAGIGGYTVVAYLIAVLWGPGGLEWFSAVLILPPLLIGEWGLRQYLVDQRLRQRVLHALAEALEVRSPGAFAHSLMVGDVAAAIAQSLGLGARQVEVVAMAGRLQDVGLLTVPPDHFEHQHELSPATAAMVSRHPAAARQILGGIDFLRGPLDLIASHHERYDGGGYPHGLAGRQIPVGARILATADAFVAFRQSREDTAPTDDLTHALEQCVALSGTALDPQCVDGLRRAIERDAVSIETLDRPVRERGLTSAEVARPETTTTVAALTTLTHR